MAEYVVRIATRDELLKRWDDLIETHPGRPQWVSYRENTLKAFDSGNLVQYYGFLDGNIISETAAYLNPAENDFDDFTGLCSDGMAYLSAFRTDKPYEGQGYFRKLYEFMEADLKSRGCTSLSIGVDPKEVRNMCIYFHLGFLTYIRTAVLKEPSREDPNVLVDEFCIFYRKDL